MNVRRLWRALLAVSLAGTGLGACGIGVAGLGEQPEAGVQPDVTTVDSSPPESSPRRLRHVCLRLASKGAAS